MVEFGAPKNMDRREANKTKFQHKKIPGNEKDWYTNLNWATTSMVRLWIGENFRFLKIFHFFFQF